MIASLKSLRARERAVLILLASTLLGSLAFYMHSRYGHGDITLYHQYAKDFWLGRHALRALPAEYPLLSLVPFTLTLLPPLPDYVSVFAVWMLLLFLAGYFAIRRWESARAAELCGVYLALGSFATVLGRMVRVTGTEGRTMLVGLFCLPAGSLSKGTWAWVRNTRV